MPTGQITKAISGFYYVQTPEQQVVRCRARGIFKEKNISPLVGDFVHFTSLGADGGLITAIDERKTELVRPLIANVDQAIVVFSISRPDIQRGLLDRILVHVEKGRLDPVICLTKMDLVEESQGEQQEKQQEIKEISTLYQNIGYPVILTSIHTHQGIEELKQILHQRVSVLAGPSGVGKSSLLQKMVTGYSLKTGQVSTKSGKGRHTTRSVEFLSLPNGGQVADTPGFSQLSFQGFDAHQLGECFPEIHSLSSQCYFRGCLHKEEPDCAVKDAVDNDKISQIRFQHYLQFLSEIQEEKRYEYD